MTLFLPPSSANRNPIGVAFSKLEALQGRSHHPRLQWVKSKAVLLFLASPRSPATRLGGQSQEGGSDRSSKARTRLQRNVADTATTIDVYSYLVEDDEGEANELLVAVALHVLADDGAVEHVEGGKQRGCAVPLRDRHLGH